jgi:hypothetical protein
MIHMLVAIYSGTNRELLQHYLSGSLQSFSHLKRLGYDLEYKSQVEQVIHAVAAQYYSNEGQGTCL